MKKVLSLFFIFVFVLTSTLSVFASDIVSNPGYSYEGLPDYPIGGPVPGSNAKYIKFNHYTLLNNGDDYMLIGYPGEERAYVRRYSDGDTLLYYANCKDGREVTYYSDSNLTNVLTTSVLTAYSVFKLENGAWVYYSAQSSHSNESIIGYDIISSSTDIYNGAEGTKVFFQSATDALIAGMSSTNLKEITMMEMVGLIPLVIGLLVALIAFYKGWAFLRRTLKTA